MDLKKIKEDFEKRYECYPKNLFFCGKPIVFFKKNGLVLGTSLSVGGYIATAKREDGRIQLSRRDSNSLFRVNIEEIGIYRGERICDLLIKLEEYGAKPQGADILIYENTDFKLPAELLLLCAQKGLCKNPILPREAVRYFDNYEENSVAVLSKSNHIIAFCGQNIEYLPFHNQKYKIVISAVRDRTVIREYASSLAEDAKEALVVQDMERFGHILDKSNRILLDKYPGSKSRRLFDIATSLGDSLGNGAFLEGGIFSVVENNRVDTFIHNLGGAYEKRVGGRPAFYITQTEDSACALPLPE